MYLKIRAQNKIEKEMYLKTRPHCIQLWCPPHKRDIGLLEQAHRRATKMIKELEHLS